jgi:hypothetical protein
MLGFWRNKWQQTQRSRNRRSQSSSLWKNLRLWCSTHANKTQAPQSDLILQFREATASQRLLRRNRRPANPGIHPVEPPGKLGKYLVHHGSDRTQRMIFPHSRFRRQITEDMILLMIVSAHAFSYHTKLWIRSSVFGSLGHALESLMSDPFRAMAGD